VDGAVSEDAIDVHGKQANGGPAGVGDDGFHVFKNPNSKRPNPNKESTQVVVGFYFGDLEVLVFGF
jgi:hypothetical protein